MKLLVADELLLDGCRIVSPGSRLNQTLEHQTGTETCVSLISTAEIHTEHVGAAKNKLILRLADKQLTHNSSQKHIFSCQIHGFHCFSNI